MALSQRSGAATKGFEFCEFSFLNLNAVSHVLGLYVCLEQIITKFCWHCVSLWSIARSLELALYFRNYQGSDPGSDQPGQMHS